MDEQKLIEWAERAVAHGVAGEWACCAAVVIVVAEGCLQKPAYNEMCLNDFCWIRMQLCVM